MEQEPKKERGRRSKLLIYEDAGDWRPNEIGPIFEGEGVPGPIEGFIGEPKPIDRNPDGTLIEEEGN